jgi:CRISPR/Cas system-associated exonuclease Cas4 (RecB family)
MLKQKYEYQALQRSVDMDSNMRVYHSPDGGKLPSVTTVLDRTKPEEAKQALQNWRNRVGHQQAQAITTEAASRGTRMHTYLENYIKANKIIEMTTNPYSWASMAMAKTVVDQGFTNRISEVYGVEIPLYFPRLYAGTTDGVGMHLGEEAILDYKQTNKPKKREWIGDYFLQLTAYALAHNEVYGSNIRKGVILMCVKPEQDANLVITAPPQYQEFILEGEEFDHYTNEWWKRLELYYLTN